MSLNLDKSTWQRVAFGDVIDSVTDRVDDPSKAGVDRYVGLEHLDPGVMTVRRWDAPDKVEAQKLRFRPGDVIFGRRRAYQKKVALAEFEGICSAHALVLRARPGRIDPTFLPVFLSSAYFLDRAVEISVGSLSPTVNWRDLRIQQFDLPPIDEQKRIAELLWTVERQRLAASQLAQAATAAKSTMLADRLARGVEKKGWVLDPVTSLVDRGPTNGKSAPSNDENRGVPTLSISAVRGGLVAGGNSVKYIDVDPATVSAFLLEDDDFLVVRGNGNRQLTGRGGLVAGGLPSGCIYPDLLIRLRFNPSRVLPRFAAEQWNSARVHAALLENAKSTNGIWKINGKDIKGHKLVVPPLSDQAMLLAEVDAFDSGITAANVEARSLKELAGTIFSTVFGGK
ncbi:restriction endonuclease subunit S [Microbacterium halotolerans]|uniref:restriction endonuclease subunit S n=1 Tax=Microbacterium halotolerans TaxID=246613 RepID=UPI0019694DC8|nr:restriction endonuclease subunit S [Microbacterium halotolerans]